MMPPRRLVFLLAILVLGFLVLRRWIFDSPSPQPVAAETRPAEKGKRPGRGMYLHANQQCWQAALKGGRIEQALRVKLSAANRQALQAYAATLPAREELPDVPDGTGIEAHEGA